MGIVERIKELCDSHGTNFAEVERKVGLSNGQIRRWDEASPKVHNIKKVANYFNVPLDYLLDGETNGNFPQPTSTDDLDEMLDTAMSFDGKPLTETDKEAIRAFLQGRLSSK